MDNFWALATGAGAGLAVLAGILLFYRLVIAGRMPTGPKQNASTLVILFRHGNVIDSTPDAADLIGRSSLHGMTWMDIRSTLLPWFSDIPEHPSSSSLKVTANGDHGSSLTIESNGDTLRLSLHNRPVSTGELHRLRLLEKEQDRQFQALNSAPMAIWHTDTNDVIDWHNEAYGALCEATNHTSAYECPIALRPRDDTETRPERASVTKPDGTHLWFEVMPQKVPDGWMYFASSIDNLVEAEMAQRNFVQTLTKTFAHLPIGLAVFDRERRLVLFNPALVDLTNLPVDFLSAKPNLLSFFDHMRENRMMPEPKSYSSWRDKLSDVVSAASEDRYSETWTLPSGLTYKITGRPHPDGAVAFLIEDISAEISLTRRFRSELEMTQSVIDGFDDAVAVFSRLGVLTFSNTAYRERWKCDPDSAFAEITVVDATREWKNACEPSPIWSDLSDFVLTLRDRSEWSAELVTRAGEHLICIVEPVAAGATMVRFSRLVQRAQPAIVIEDARTIAS